MQNKFFEAAINQAAGMAGKKGRLIRLLGRMALKLQDFNWKNANALSFKSKLTVLGRLCTAYALGHYRQVDLKTVLGVVAAIIYFVNPLDLIPDLLPMTGYIDDFAILMWVYNSITDEVSKFLSWEQSR